MGFHATRLIFTWLLLLFLLLLSLFAVSGTTAVSVKCDKCEKSRCPQLHYCGRAVVKDQCGCCDVCATGSKVYGDALMRDEEDTRGNACAKVRCPKFKVCMENMQGLPLCTCPSTFICKRRSRQRPVCGSDRVTYETRCHLRIAACNAGSKIKVWRKGKCSEPARPRSCNDFSSCKRRKNQNPVCGTDLKTYISRCHMKIVACQRGVKIKLRHSGSCESSVRSTVTTSQRGGGQQVKTQDSDVNKNSRRENRRRRKNKVGSDVAGNDDTKRNRRKQRRDRRKRKERRRRRRKTRGSSRPRRYKVDRRVHSRNTERNAWK